MADLIIANKSDLVSIADAIREKAGLTDGMSFPDEFLDVVNGIESGIVVDLPSGYALECGTYIPASDITDSSNVHIYLKNTYKWYTSDRIGNTFCALFGIDINNNFIPSAIAGLWFCNYTGVEARRNFYIKEDGSLGSTSAGTLAGFSTNGTSNLLRLKGLSLGPLKAGINYFWIVVGEVA